MPWKYMGGAKRRVGWSAVIAAIWPGWETLGGGVALFGYALPHFIAFMIFWALNVFIIFRGMDAVRIFENWAAPLVLVEIYQRISGKVEILNVGPFLVRYTAAISVLLTIIAFSARGGREFIYFDF